MTLCKLRSRRVITDPVHLSNPIRNHPRNPEPTMEEELEYDTLSYSSKENFRWAMWKRMNTLVVEKTVTDEIDDAFHLRAGYATFGWDRLLTLSGDYYPELIRQFYANMEGKPFRHRHPLVSQVKGVKITVTTQLINEMLGLPTIGDVLTINQDRVTSDLAWRAKEAAQRFNVDWTPTQSKLLAKYFEPGDRLLAYSFGFNVIPKGSSRNELRIADLYFLDKMRFGMNAIQGIPIGYTILSRIRELLASRRRDITVIFPMLLTRVLQYHGVDFTGEFRCITTTADEISFETVFNMGYYLKDGRWAHRKDIPQAWPISPRIEHIETEHEEAATTSASGESSAARNTGQK